MATAADLKNRRYSLVEIALLAALFGGQVADLRLGGKSADDTDKRLAAIEKQIGDYAKRQEDDETSHRRQDLAMETLARQLSELDKRVGAPAGRERLR